MNTWKKRKLKNKRTKYIDSRYGVVARFKRTCEENVAKFANFGGLDYMHDALSRPKQIGCLGGNERPESISAQVLANFGALSHNRDSLSYSRQVQKQIEKRWIESCKFPTNEIDLVAIRDGKLRGYSASCTIIDDPIAEWKTLDGEAKAKLNDADFKEFLRYRDELRCDGETWEYAQDILNGFIWGCIETYDD